MSHVEKLYWKLPFNLNLSSLYLLQFQVLFVSVFSESFSLGYSVPAVLSYLIWLCRSWLLIKFSLNCKKDWSTKSLNGSNFILFMFTASWTSFFCSSFQYICGKLDSNSFSSLSVQNKSSTWWANFSTDKSLLGTWYWEFRLTLRYCLVFPEIVWE